MKSILLVSVIDDMEISEWISHHTAQPHVRKAFSVPLSLGIIAALTPEQYKVVIWDEAVHGRIGEHTDLSQHFDLIGITAYSSQLARAKELAQMFRRQGVPVVAGGAGVIAAPKDCRGHFDVLFLGEAEETWPKFLAEWEAGTHASQYAPSHFPDLSLSPKPRWDSIAHLLPTSYKYGAVQINRGCPYDCEFCDIWSHFGRTVRSKPVQQVIEEVSELARLGMQAVYFANDNFYGNPKHAREVVRELATLNRTLDPSLSFTTELSINISHDDEFLRNLADAGFINFYIGVESSNIESLKETRKRHNLHGDLAAQCLKIASYGVPVQAGMIVGFDSDPKDIFERHFDFIQKACIPHLRLSLLLGLPGTGLRERLTREGRVLDMEKTLAGHSSCVDKLGFSSNILFKCMSRSEVYTGLLQFVGKLWDWKNIEARLCGFIDNVKRQPERKLSPRLQQTVAKSREFLPRMPGANAEVIERVLAHAERVTPLLLRAIARQLALACWEVAQLESARAAIRKQIEIEWTLEERNGYVMEHGDPDPPLTLATAASSSTSRRAS